MFKIKKTRKYIILSPVPQKTVFNALVIEFDKETESCTKLATADIREGQSKYSLPDDKRKIIKIYVDEALFK